MKAVRLPSGTVLNLDLIEMLTPNGGGGIDVAFNSSVETLTFIGADAAMLIAWVEKRPLLVPLARGKGKTS